MYSVNVYVLGRCICSQLEYMYSVRVYEPS